MIINSIKIQGHRCFKNHWTGFDEFKPINVIIGRNNTGKSHLLDIVEALCGEGNLKGRGWKYYCSGTLTDQILRRVFPQNQSGGNLPGDHWFNNGLKFVGKSASWISNNHGNASDLEIHDSSVSDRADPRTISAQTTQIVQALKLAESPLKGKFYKRLLADRDIQPESQNNEFSLFSNGVGASNIIRKYILSSDADFPREIVQKDLLRALNQIFGQDGHFTEIQIQFHDKNGSERPQSKWEIYLGEEKKGLVPLGNSGSGLKTVILVLLNLLVVPHFEKKPKSQYVFAFEELENNLHPALLRRLLQFIEEYAVKENCLVFLTTHSSAALDLFGVSNNAQIVHVTHDGESAKATTVSAHFDKLGVVSELGAKPSDLLQSNGIIWVEGPSDMIYLNRWIDLYTDGRLQEGRDYQCAYYGGSLLARTQLRSPEAAEEHIANLFRINPNIVVVCDGDRSGKGKRVKDRVRRIQADVKAIPGAHIWVTQAREIENYLPGVSMANALERSAIRDPGQYESFFPKKSAGDTSFLESQLNRKTLDKTDFAIQCAPHLTLDNMKPRFDWEDQMEQLIKRIETWNA